MEFLKSNLTPQERVELDNLRATAAKNQADLEYLAMMTDVELDTGEDAVVESEVGADEV